MLWLKRLLDKIGSRQDRYLVYCDTECIIHLGKNSNFHLRNKNINVRYHWVRIVLDAKSIKLAKIHINRNVSNMLTKVVSKEKHVFCRNGVGMEAFSYIS